jgi:hypothetical protein
MAHGKGYRPVPAGRAQIPWHLHPRSRAAGVIPSSVDLTPFRPPIYDQGSIGECSGEGTVGSVTTTLAKAGTPVSALLSPLSVYRLGRCIERALKYSGGVLPKLTDSGANPDDVFRALNLYGVATCQDVAGVPGPCAALTAYEEAHVNDEPSLEELELDDKFKALGQFLITSTGQQRLDDVARALASGFAVGFSVYASDDRFQRYAGGVMGPPPSGVYCDHWVYMTGFVTSVTNHRIYRAPNSWGEGWGEQGEFQACEEIVLASDCVEVASVKKAA